MRTELTTTHIPLQNLDCPDCAKKLEKKVAELDGVHQARVNLVTSRLTVAHRGSTSPIIDAVRRQGHLQTRPNEIFWRQPRTVLTGLAGMLLLAAWLLPQWRPALLLAATVAGGIFPALSGFRTLAASRSFDINVLMTVAVTGAVAIGELGEAATVVFLFSLGHTLEAWTMGRTRRSIRNLMKLAPAAAWIEGENGLKQVAAAELQPGQKIVIRPGDRVPVDGIITDGRSEVNQAPVTGESLPVAKEPGQQVFAGSINGSGRLDVQVTHTTEDSSLARIVQLVEEATASRPPIQQFVDRFARWYTPAVIALAAAIIALPPLVLGLPWQDWLYRGLTLLVVSCPCALVISTPVSIVSALGNAARNGVLIKDGRALELAAAVKTVAMDKTGTLTQGRPALVRVQGNGHSVKQVLQLAASVEQGSSHPLASAVLEAAAGEPLLPASEHQTLPGHGAVAKINGAPVYAVSPAYARQHLGIDPPAGHNADATLVVLAERDQSLGWLEFRDQLRPGAAETIKNLQEIGANTVMLTGDNPGAAALIAREAGIGSWQAQLLPGQKLTEIGRLRQHSTVMMVGDGINDAPALAAADVGVAMGAMGSDTALETADIALMADRLDKLPWLLRLSRRALATIRANIWFAVLVKLAAVLLVFPGWLTLWLAIMADTGATLVVTLNGMRLLGDGPLSH